MIYGQRLHFIMSSKDLKAAADKKRNSLKSEAKKEKALRNEDKRRLRVESDPTYQVSALTGVKVMSYHYLEPKKLRF